MHFIARMIHQMLPLYGFFQRLHVILIFSFFHIIPILTILATLAIYRLFRPFRLGSFQVSFREVTDPKESPGRIENRATDASDPMRVHAGGQARSGSRTGVGNRSSTRGRSAAYGEEHGSRPVGRAAETVRPLLR